LIEEASMSDVAIFVDDAVLGRLPMVCVRTGAPADGLHRIHQRIGGQPGWALLLVLLGPIGWIVLIALAVTSRSRELMVRLPTRVPVSNGRAGTSARRWSRS
jgi:hypothetical protein